MSRQTIVITGASTGFGRATAERFAREGWRVFAGMRDVDGRNADNARALRALSVEPVELDVTKQSSVDAAADAILAAGPVDVLFNNAGTLYAGVAEAFTPEAAEAQFATNVFGVHRVSRAFIPGMRERKRGLIVYTSSIFGSAIAPFTGIYSASKWALEALAESTAYELRPFGIDVAIVQPGAYPTNLGSAAVTPDDGDRVAQYGEVVAYQEAIFAALARAAEGRSSSDVAEAVWALAAQAPGTRPLRTTVPRDPFVEAMNLAKAPHQKSMLEAFGLGALIPKEAERAAV